MWSNKEQSKIYKNNDQMIVIDSDMQHSGGWLNEKPSQQKQAVQLIQIDRIFKGVIRQRMFGDLINRKNQLLESAYGDLTKATIDTFCDWSTKNGRRYTVYSSKSPTKPNTKSTFRFSREARGNRTADKMLRITWRKSRTAGDDFSKKLKLSLTQKKMQLSQQSLTNLHLNNNQSFQDFFRRVANVSAKGILVQGKVSREQLKQLFRLYKINQEIVDRFLTFFDFPAVMHYRQFMTILEGVVNKTSLRQINFLVFQLLDRDKDGMVSVSDLFKFLGENGGAGVLIERDIFMCSGYIQQTANSAATAANFLTDVGGIEKKDLSTDELLIRNHNMRLQTYRELVKQDNSQIVTCPIMKSTIYHQTFNALQHSANVRLKNYNLEVNKSESKMNRSGIVQNTSSKSDRMSLVEFYKLFAEDRPGIFYFFIETITGHKFQHIQYR